MLIDLHYRLSLKTFPGKGVKIPENSSFSNIEETLLTGIIDVSAISSIESKFFWSNARMMSCSSGK